MGPTSIELGPNERQPTIGVELPLTLPTVSVPSGRLPVCCPAVRRLMGEIAWQATMQVLALARFRKQMKT